MQLATGSFVPAATGPVVAAPEADEVFGGKFYRAVQFYAMPTDVDKARLAAKGVTLHRYLPTNTFTAAIPSDIPASALATEANIRAVFSMPAAQKLSGELLGGNAPAHALRSGGTVALNIIQQPGLSTADVAAWLRRDGATVTASLKRLETHAVVIPLSRVADLAALPYVAFVEAAEPTPTPDNTGGRTSHRSNTLATYYTGGLKYDGAGVTVALNDDGVIGPHIDYAGRLPAQYTSVNTGNHGDHCAGIIFSAGNRAPTARGMASGATLRVYRASSPTPAGYQGFDSIYNHHANLGVRITSTSYSDGLNSGYTTRARLMDETIRDLPGLMHVFSAGNNGTSSSSYGAGPGWANITGGHKMAKNTIAVGNLDSLDNLNSSSSRGPASDGRIKPEVCAVGTAVQSTVDANSYINMTGTSMACPGVAGTLAQLYHGWKSLHGGIDPPSALIKAAVLNTADDLGNAGPDFKHGFGRINARRAFAVLQGAQFFNDVVSQGAAMAHTITVPAGAAEVRVMLYWHDVEATAGAATALVNDLNLTLTTPAAAAVLPWKLNRTANATALNQPAFQGIDSLNNMEQVTMAAPAAGTYTINVTGAAVPQGPQAYYVVYEIVESGVTLTYPIGGESLVPGVPEVIRWDAYGNTTPFALDYSTDSGATWSSIAPSILASQRHYNWTPPTTVTGRGMIRVTRGTSSDASDAGFAVIGVPGSLAVNWVCVDSMQVSYSSVSGAAGYVVTALGATYMDSVGSSSTTSAIARGLNTGVQNWYSVQAVAPNGARGRRAIAQIAPVVPFNCSVPFDLALQSISSPASAISHCAGGASTDSVRIVVKNNGLTAMTGVTAGYSLDGSTPVTAVVPGTIAALSTRAFTFPTPLSLTGGGVYMLRVWAQASGDAVPGNDTVVQTIIINAATPTMLPVIQDFETATLCDTAANCEAVICALPGGWTNAASGDLDSVDWRVWRGPTPTNLATSTTGPIMDYKPGIGSGRYIYLEADGCAGKTAHLLSPCIDLTGVTDAQLRWGYHMMGSGIGELHVDVQADGVWNLDVATALVGAQGSMWKQGLLSLSTFHDKVIQLRFRGITGPTAQSDIALDGIEVTSVASVENTPVNGLSMTISPNPSAGDFIATLNGLKTEASLTITDIAGRVVGTTTVLPRAGAATVTLPLGNQPAGVYFLAARSAGGNWVRKLVRL